ncbi:MAG: 50S ribosomal protein L11 methyltransferase [Mailhella sp.]|nr:50S ribosomal protein L11 methyltransferase [Mailhella sp.]
MLERLEIIVPEADIQAAEAVIAEYMPDGWQEESLSNGTTKYILHAEDPAAIDAVLDAVRKALPGVNWSGSSILKQDWTESWKQYFTPVDAGKFVILPPWLKGKVRSSLIPIVIEPKSAFGTGHHATTALCLEALSTLSAEGAVRPGQSFLDLGTGTGILGMSCIRLGLTGIGLDIDPLAVANARENAALNSIPTASSEDGTAPSFVIDEGGIECCRGMQFDIVIANILAEPLCEMAEDIMACVRPGGCLILSGFLTSQKPMLEEAYARMGTGRQIGREGAVKDSEWIAMFWP